MKVSVYNKEKKVKKVIQVIVKGEMEKVPVHHHNHEPKDEPGTENTTKNN